MVASRISQPDCAEGVVFDGFPRTVAQAAALDHLLKDMGRRVDVVLNMRSLRCLVAAVGGSLDLPRCGAIYHRLFSPEKVQGVCDECGGTLYQRRMITWRRNNDA